MNSDEKSLLRNKIAQFFESTWNIERFQQKFRQDLSEIDSIKGQFACIMLDYRDLIKLKDHKLIPVAVSNGSSNRNARQAVDHIRSKTPTRLAPGKSNLHHEEKLSGGLSENSNMVAQRRREGTANDRSKTPEPVLIKNEKHEKEKIQAKRKSLIIRTDKLEIEQQKPIAKRDMTPLSKPKARRDSEVAVKFSDDIHYQYYTIKGDKKALTTPSTIKRKDEGTPLNFKKNFATNSEASNKQNGMMTSNEVKKTAKFERRSAHSKTVFQVAKPKPLQKLGKQEEANSSLIMADQMNESFHADEKKMFQDKLNEIKIQNENKIREMIQNRERRRIKFSSKWLECFYLVGCSKVVPFDLRVVVHSSTREIYEKNGLKQLLFEKIEQLELVIKDKERILGKYDLSSNSIINKSFCPSKTAQNGLNFITKEEESNLCRRDQSEEVLNIFRAIYLFLGEDYKDIPSQKLIENLTTVLFKKFGVDSIKSLCVNKLAKSKNISPSQFEELLTMYKDNPTMFSSGDILRMNRSVSYMTFILREMYDYTTAKLNDGTCAFYMRNLIQEVNTLKEKLSKLKELLN